MKKQGFTLAELIVTLGVIGVISALTISIATKLIPDKNKVLCLKAFDTVSNTIQNLAFNSKIYPTCKDANSDENNINCKNFPLFNTDKTLAFNDDLYSGDKKLCSLLAYSMGVNEANINIYYSTEANIALTSAIKSSFFVLTAFTKAFFNKDLALFGLLKSIIICAADL